MSLSDCFVSVVAPLSNDADIAESFVRETAEVLKSNYANYELVLVDDGSRDGTPELLHTLAAEVPELVAVIESLAGRLSAPTMQRLNAAVDLEHRSPEQVIRQWRRASARTPGDQLRDSR